MTYLLRAIKYFLFCCVLASVVVAGLLLAGWSQYGFEDGSLFARQCLVMIGILAAIAAIYPKIGFTKRRVAGDLSAEGRATAMNAFAEAGYRLTSEEQGVLRFRAKQLGRRLRRAFDDELTLTQEGGWLQIEGHRTEVFRVLHHWDAYARYEAETENEGETKR